MTEDQNLQEYPLPEEEKLSVEDYNNDPRYAHLRSEDWNERYARKFNTPMQVTEYIKPQIKKLSIGEAIDLSTNNIPGFRTASEIEYDLNQLAVLWERIGIRYDQDYSYKRTRDLNRQLIMWAIAHPESTLDLNKGIMVYGDIGTGKTMSMIILSHFMNLMSMSKLRYKIRKADDIVDEVMTTGKMDQIKRLAESHLFVDEVGQERIEINYYGNEICVMEKLLLYAYDSYKTRRTFLHISSNYAPEVLGDFYGRRVSSRIQEMFNCVHVKGIDIRSTK